MKKYLLAAVLLFCSLSASAMEVKEIFFERTDVDGGFSRCVVRYEALYAGQKGQFMIHISNSDAVPNSTDAEIRSEADKKLAIILAEWKSNIDNPPVVSEIVKKSESTNRTVNIP